MYNEQFKINEKSNFPGVYIIVNLDNRKVYVGSTRNILRRLKEHEAKLRKGKHDVKRMQKDYDNGNQSRNLDQIFRKTDITHGLIMQNLHKKAILNGENVGLTIIFSTKKA